MWWHRGSAAYILNTNPQHLSPNPLTTHRAYPGSIIVPYMPEWFIVSPILVYIGSRSGVGICSSHIWDAWPYNYVGGTVTCYEC